MTPRWKRGEYVAPNGFALKGFDPVAYFNLGRAVRGTPEWELEWSGTRWRFSSSENKRLFEADPEAYAPQFGGRCAFAVSFSANPKAPESPPGSPRLWKIVDGRLYLNQNPFAHLVFNLASRREAADRVWEELSV